MRSDHWTGEAGFFDAVAERHRAQLQPTDPLAIARYSSPRLRRRFARELRFRIVGDLRGKVVADVGCGEGRDTVMLAKLGAKRVIGIDLSPKAIELARDRARIDSVSDRVELVCAPVELVELASDCVDVVWCNAILHHLTENLDPVMRSIVRWARPEAILTFQEPTNLNQTLRRIRKLIPVRATEPTPDERPLEATDLAIIARYVRNLQHRHFGLFGRLDPFVLTSFNYERSSALRRAFVNVSAAVDWALLGLPGFDRLGSRTLLWGQPDKSAIAASGARVA